MFALWFVCTCLCVQVARVNVLLGDKVEQLSAATEKAKMRLSLFIQWWAEYYGNHDDLCVWLEGASTRLAAGCCQSREHPTTHEYHLLSY